MITDEQGRALVVLGIEAARVHGKTWTPSDVASVVRKLADLGDVPSTTVAKLEAAARDPQAATPAAALWPKYGNTRPAPSAIDETDPVCERCGRSPDACPIAQSKVPAEFRDAHEFTPRRRPGARRTP